MHFFDFKYPNNYTNGKKKFTTETLKNASFFLKVSCRAHLKLPTTGKHGDVGDVGEFVSDERTVGRGKHG